MVYLHIVRQEIIIQSDVDFPVGCPEIDLCTSLEKTLQIENTNTLKINVHLDDLKYTVTLC